MHKAKRKYKNSKRERDSTQHGTQPKSVSVKSAERCPAFIADDQLFVEGHSQKTVLSNFLLQYKRWGMIVIKESAFSIQLRYRKRSLAID